jgi:hypothetical protein
MSESPEVTQRIPKMPGMASGVLGLAGEDKAGPSVKVVAIPTWEYIFVDILAFAYVTGWITASAFYATGNFEQHGSGVGVLSALGDISLKAFIPAAVLAAKDLAQWLHKRRQAHGLG